MVTDAAWLMAELAVLFFGVACAVHLLQRALGPDRLRAWMGGRPITAALKGIAVGFVTPFCTYSAIPVLAGLRRAGVPPAGYVAFIAAAPVLDPVLFGALALIAGIEAAVFYAAVAFVGALTLALTAEHMGIDRHLKDPSEALGAPIPASVAVGVDTRSAATHRAPGDGADRSGDLDRCGDPGGQVGCSPTPHAPWTGLRHELGPAIRSSVAMLRSVAALLVVGVTIGLLIESLVSPETVATITGDNGPWAIPVAAALGTPLYFDTSLFVPIASSLSNAGVGIGAIVALTIAGAGANVPEFVLLTRFAHRGVLTIFFGYVFAVAATGGLIAQVVLG